MSRMLTLWISSLFTILLLSACTLAMPAAQESEMTSPATEPMATSTAKEEMAKEEMAKEEMAKEEMAKEEMAKEEMAKEEMAKEEMAKEEMAKEEMAKEEMAEGEMAKEEMTKTETMAAMDLPTWQTIALTDARTGETFTLADYAGKTVFVETMATWCPNCKQQLSTVKSAVAQADPGKTAFIALSVETDLDPSALAQYADQNGFEWRFAVASRELVQALAATFGTTIVNPPSTPHFILRADGSYTDLSTGIHSSEEILAELSAAMVQ